MVAVARHAVLIVDAPPDREVRRHVTGPAQRVVETDERDRLAAERDLRRRRWMNRPQVRGRGDAGPDLAVRKAADDQSDRGEQGRAHNLEAWLDEHVVQRLLERCPALFLVAHQIRIPTSTVAMYCNTTLFGTTALP